jgi:hypothetical protein
LVVKLFSLDGRRRFRFVRRWSYALAPVVLSVAAFNTIACRRWGYSEPEITVRQEITPRPVRAGIATIAIQLTDLAAKPISRATIEVEADMSHPGMSPVFAQAAETTPGSYQAHLGFNMGGDWVVLLHIRLPDGRKVEREISVPGVLSN